MGFWKVCAMPLQSCEQTKTKIHVARKKFMPHFTTREDKQPFKSIFSHGTGKRKISREGREVLGNPRNPQQAHNNLFIFLRKLRKPRGLRARSYRFIFISPFPENGLRSNKWTLCRYCRNPKSFSPTRATWTASSRAFCCSALPKKSTARKSGSRRTIITTGSNVTCAKNPPG